MATILRPRKNTATPTNHGQKSPKDILVEGSAHGICTVPLDVEALSKLYAIKIIREVMDDEISGKLEKRNSGNWVIYVNSLHHPKRQRFTIAHELGHYFLHSQKQKFFEDVSFSRSSGDSSPIEVEANRFAAELLMPEATFKQAVLSGINKVSTLADHFQTSMFAVEVRAKQLGYRV